MVRVPRLVVVVTRESLRAVMCRGGLETWRHEISMSSFADVPTAFQAILAAAPRERARDVFIGLTHPLVRQRTLPSGVPGTTREEIALLLDSHIDEFFLGDATTARATVARQSGESWTAAAFDAPVVQTMTALAEETRLRVVGVFPVGTPIAPDTPDVSWASALRVANDGQHELMWRLEPQARGRRAHSVVRTLLTIAAVASGLLAYVAPALVLEVQARGVETSVRLLDGRMRALAAAVGDEVIPTSVLERAERTARESAALVDLLVRVFDSLPDSAALTSIRLDSASAVLTVVAPPTQSALRSVIGVPGAESARLVGPVATDVIDGVEVHRATVQWRVSSHPRAPAPGVRP